MLKMKTKHTLLHYLGTVCLLLALVLLPGIFAGCVQNSGSGSATTPPSGNNTDDPPTQQGETEWSNEYTEAQLIDNTFRIDIQTIRVVFDYWTDRQEVQCHAEINFTMRPGQIRPVIHLTPALKDIASVTGIRLNGENLTPNDSADIKIISHEYTAQRSLEFQRDLASNTGHFLEIDYLLSIPGQVPKIETNVHDPSGIGNEAFFPTINTPHELARHILTFRVHSDQAFRFFGSGLVQENEQPNCQEWILDTEREIASYTIMFVLMPEADTQYLEGNIAGVDLRVMSYENGPDPQLAFQELENYIPQLISDLGPFPMPRGLSIFLTAQGGGMEYFGGTISSLRALQHEIFHMYYACSTVNKTYRDTWIDEAVNMWYEGAYNGVIVPIGTAYRSNIVSGRTPVSLGFDMRAYEEGAQIMEAVSVELGGRDRMVEFLRYVYTNYAFKPFTTQEFLDYLQDFAGVDMRDRFSQWLYTNNIPDSQASTHADAVDRKERVDMTPPDSILKKYREK